MSEGISIEQAKDLGALTLQSIDRKFESVLAHNAYPFIDRMYKGDRVNTLTGDQIDRDIVLGVTGNAKHVKLFAEDQQTITNITKKISIPWRHAKSSMSYERRELLVQGGPEKVVDIFTVRKTNMYAELADEIEARLWKTPDTSADDTNPYGIPYWLPVGLTTNQGWYGLNPKYMDGNEITAGAGGISTTTYAKWKSYYADYTEVNDDFLDKLSTAFRRSKFKSPVIIGMDFGNDPNNGFALYTNNNVIQQAERLARLSDDQVGVDLGKYQGATVYKRLPLEYTDLLDCGNGDGTTDNCTDAIHGVDPLYGINWNMFELSMLKGDKFVLSPPMNSREQNNVFTVFCDLSYNILCKNRQKAGFVVSIV